MDDELFDPVHLWRNASIERGDLMVVHFRSTYTSSRPERKEVTEEIERRFRLQEEAEQAAELQQEMQNEDASKAQS